MDVPDYGFLFHIRHFKICGSAKRVKKLQKKLKEAKSLVQQVVLAENEPGLEHCAAPSFTVAGVKNPETYTTCRKVGGWVLIDGGQNWGVVVSELPRSDPVTGIPAEKPSASRPVTGKLIRDGLSMWVEVKSYNGDKKRGKLSVEYVLAEDGRVDGHLTLDEESFEAGQTRYFVREESPGIGDQNNREK